MKIKMLVAVHGKVNGERMGPYYLGYVYAVPEDISEARARLFMGSAMAEEAIDPPPEEEVAAAPDVETEDAATNEIADAAEDAAEDRSAEDRSAEDRSAEDRSAEDDFSTTRRMLTTKRKHGRE